MRAHGPTTCLVLAAFLATTPLAAQLSSSSKNVAAADCSGLTLAGAGGVPDGPVHGYKFHGICRIISVNYSSEEVAGFTYDTDKDARLIANVWTVATVKWDKASGQMIEQVKTEGAYAGAISMVLKCAQDPVITSAACQPVAYENSTNWSGFDVAWNKAQPLTRGRTTLVEASAFSKKSGGNPPPPSPKATVPPPKSKPPVTTRIPTTTTAAAQPVAVVPVQPAKPGFRPVTPRIVDPRELSLSLRTWVRLDNGRSLGVRRERDGLHWAILGERGEVMRLFPPGSRAYRSLAGKVTVDWGGGVYEAGTAIR